MVKKNETKIDENFNDIEKLPILPLRNSIFFPGAVMPIAVGRTKTMQLIEDHFCFTSQKNEEEDNSLESAGFIGIVTQKSAEIDEPTLDDIFHIGSIARMIKLSRGSKGFNIVVEGLKRFQIVELVQESPFFVAKIKTLGDNNTKSVEIEALYLNLKGMARDVIDLLPEIPLMAKQLIDSISFPGQLADMIAANLDATIQEKQKILEAIDIQNRLTMVLKLLNKQREVLKLSNKIHTQVKGEMSRSHREYFLRQQLKAIKEELGEKDDDDNSFDELEKKIAATKVSEDARKALIKEFKRLKQMQPHQAEYIVSKTYIDWILELPWNNTTKEVIDIKEAHKQLNSDHYGLDKVKRRIIEFLAVRKLKPDVNSPILCLVGPPGVGKTSLGKSIAKTLKRAFHRMSLGGVRDEAEIRGHRRTYIGALPGRIIQGLKKSGTDNPVFLLDEIDKLGNDFRGDPASALLEVLDPEQNHSFSDHYLEISFDISKVLFIATANQMNTIPAPLIDRMEVLDISGYTYLEKTHIAKKYLIPKQLKAHGIADQKVSFTDQAILKIAIDYTREAGVRNLEREIAAICRYIATDIVEHPTKLNSFVVKKNSLKKFLGTKKFHNELFERGNIAGVATGLAWTAAGGELLFIESTKMSGKGSIVLTGQLGKVMKESVQTALSWIKSQASNFNISSDIYKNNDIHIHFPSASIPKDGPSAGVTIVTVLLSLLTGISVESNIAMTGEITLKGFVLPVGGVKEKVLAAHRGGLTTVILPYGNKNDLSDIPGYVKSKINFIFVRRIEEVLKASIIIK